MQGVRGGFLGLAGILAAFFSGKIASILEADLRRSNRASVFEDGRAETKSKGQERSRSGKLASKRRAPRRLEILSSARCGFRFSIALTVSGLRHERFLWYSRSNCGYNETLFHANYTIPGTAEIAKGKRGISQIITVFFRIFPLFMAMLVPSARRGRHGYFARLLQLRRQSTGAGELSFAHPVGRKCFHRAPCLLRLGTPSAWIRNDGLLSPRAVANHVYNAPGQSRISRMPGAAIGA